MMTAKDTPTIKEFDSAFSIIESLARVQDNFNPQSLIERREHGKYFASIEHFEHALLTVRQDLAARKKSLEEIERELQKFDALPRTSQLKEEPKAKVALQNRDNLTEEIAELERCIKMGSPKLLKDARRGLVKLMERVLDSAAAEISVRIETEIESARNSIRSALSQLEHYGRFHADLEQKAGTKLEGPRLEIRRKDLLEQLLTIPIGELVATEDNGT